MNEALRLLQLEDPSFHLTTDIDTGQLLISGMGELHLDIIRDRIQNHYKVNATMGKVCISYRSTIDYNTKESLTSYLDTIGKRQSATITLSLHPSERGSGNSFLFDLKPIDSQLDFNDVVNSIQDGVMSSLQKGFLGYPCKNSLFQYCLTNTLFFFTVIDVKVTLEDLAIESDSSLASFRKCASQLISKMLTSAGPKLLEPIMNIEVLFLFETLCLILSF